VDRTNDPAVITAALDGVAPRLRRVREQRGFTLTAMSERTGISKSTLSRLENGQRKPSLELLLPLAQAYRVPLDDLVGAPEVGDPRIRLKPRRVNGRTVLQLTHPGGIQAWKIVIPASQSKPTPRAHHGFEWLYVLAGRMRLILGDQDLVLGVGEAVESTPRCRTGSAAPVTARPRCSASSGGPVSGCTSEPNRPATTRSSTVRLAWTPRSWLTAADTVAWVSLDEADQNASTFWTYVVASLDRAVPGTGAGALPRSRRASSRPRSCSPGCSTS
jgi:transcriptional regulator with XRE-family HTH domain